MSKVNSRALKITDIIRIVPYVKKSSDKQIKYVLQRDSGADGYIHSYDIRILDVLETDPIIVEVFGSQYTTREIISNEDLKRELSLKFNVKLNYPKDEIDTNKVLGLPEKEPVKPKFSPEELKTELEKFLRDTKKVTRYCLCEGCDTKITVYRSDLKRGRGLFCKIDHTNLCKSIPRVLNVCRICETEYSALYPEEFCSEECEEFYKTHF
ncbi:MAG: hypothetical protein PHC75_08030 [Burkholderiales bacterium]|nr:hypothetical protein [Burkholderiales bacterium]